MREEDFLEEIRRVPADNAPRLLLADWLDERGDPRGEFIRIQCALAAMPADDSGRKALAERNAELEAEAKSQALAELRPAGVLDVRFHRGFIDRMHVEGTQFLDMWRPIARLAPTLGGLAWRKLPSKQAPAALGKLLEGPAFAHLSALDLSGNALMFPAVDVLASSKAVRRLVTLKLNDNPLGGEAGMRLARSTEFQKLQRLELARCGLTPRETGVLARNAGLTALETLMLGGNALGDDGFRNVALAAPLENLRTLSVVENEIGLPGVTAFAESSRLVRLSNLDLSNNWIGDAGAEALATSSSCGRLTELKLLNCGISEGGLATLRKSPWLARIERLEASDDTPPRRVPRYA
ncbi:MAG: TIGR02996 domain-containing protein [Planctomycetaceae bacterium]|nr:TIGR02996 domain-containing protein [Planctomycetaceae bacterium]